MNMSAEASQVTNLARLVGCFDEEGFAKLAGVKLSTLNTWRKRGQGPEYILLGCNYLYPISGVQRHLTSLIRTRSNINPRSVLI